MSDPLRPAISWGDALLRINELINELQAKKEIISKLVEYARHEFYCIRNQWEGGQSTGVGGYKEKFGKKWYESKPVDKTPKCNCGLAEALSLIEKKKTHG